MQDHKTPNSNFCAPLLSSQAAGWNGIYLEHHHQPAQEIAQINLNCFVVNIQLGFPVEVEWWLNGKWGQERRRRGDILIAPPGNCPKIRR